MRASQGPMNAPHDYAGPERRRSPRIRANYPVRFRFVSPSGEQCERYAQTKNVSADGLLLTCMDVLEPGTEMDVSIGVPVAYATSMPAAQLNGVTVVLRCESVGPDEEYAFGRNVALKFLRSPTLSTEFSMFD